MTETSVTRADDAAPAAREDASGSAQERSEDLVIEDLLVEDVSIDGMCGVY
jgi:mycofactocin precursor